MAGMPYLLDSNILLRWVKPDHNDYPLVVSAIETILRRDGQLCKWVEDGARGKVDVLNSNAKHFLGSQPCVEDCLCDVS